MNDTNFNNKGRKFGGPVKLFNLNEESLRYKIPKGQGLVVLFDGMDSAGKSTQINLLKSELESQGYSVYTEHFPRENTNIGKSIYQLLNSSSRIPKERPDIMQRLYIADQILFEEEELPNLKKQYDFILLDRHMLSTIAFATSCGVPFNDVRSWQGALSLPNFSFIFTISPDTIFERRKGTSLDAFESKRDFIEKVNKNYTNMFDCFENSQNEPNNPSGGLNGALIDAEYSIEEIHEACLVALIFAVRSITLRR